MFNIVSVRKLLSDDGLLSATKQNSTLISCSLKQYKLIQIFLLAGISIFWYKATRNIYLEIL